MSDTSTRCEWFALCDHVAAGVVSHPILGDVPTCQRCADKLGLTFTESDVTTDTRSLLAAEKGQ
jgi:hypothetical protein